MLCCSLPPQAQIYARRQEEFAALRHAHERQLQARREQLRYERMVERRRAYLERCRRQIAAKVSEVEAEEESKEAARRKQVGVCVIRYMFVWEVHLCVACACTWSAAGARLQPRCRKWKQKRSQRGQHAGSRCGYVCRYACVCRGLHLCVGCIYLERLFRRQVAVKVSEVEAEEESKEAAHRKQVGVGAVGTVAELFHVAPEGERLQIALCY